MSQLPQEENSQAPFTMTGPKLLVSASLLSSNLLRVGDEVARMEKAGVDWLHLDAMDAHFVDNLAFGPMAMAAVRSVATKPVQAHLMMNNPGRFAHRYIEAGAVSVTIHAEVKNFAHTLREIRAAGVQAGLALNPDTPFEVAAPFLSEIDLLLVMTVHPGFSGQSFIQETMQKVAKAARARRAGAGDFRIQVDGGINVETGRVAVQTGADVLVSGNHLFKASDAAEAVRALRALGSEPGNVQA